MSPSVHLAPLKTVLSTDLDLFPLSSAVDKAIVQGMEKAECGEEGLWENSWDGEEDYHPFHKQPVLLE